MNTFSKTLAPSIRISYMVLPGVLMEQFRESLGYYSCTVSSFEQYTLARFLETGHFEKHINRMRKFYKSRRDRVASAITNCPLSGNLTILEENAGLHFLLRVSSPLTADSLVQRFGNAGIRIRGLSSYYHGQAPDWAQQCLVVNYSGLSDLQAEELERKLAGL